MFKVEKGVVIFGGNIVEVRVFEYSFGILLDGVMGLLVVVFVDDSLGCSLLDYDRLLVFGVVVLVDCGVCFFV